MSDRLKIAIIATFALVIGVVIGFFAGRTTLERSWAQPYAEVTPKQAERWASADADPSPKAGTTIVKPMPIGRVRATLGKMTVSDPAISTVGSIGSGDDGLELHVTIENRGKCKITSAAGVAYGFDAEGMPAATNKHGEPFVAFKLDAPIEVGKKAVASQKLRYAKAATLAVAQIDRATCADGSSWNRP
jgi:hypothetical protein